MTAHQAVLYWSEKIKVLGSACDPSKEELIQEYAVKLQKSDTGT